MRGVRRVNSACDRSGPATLSQLPDAGSSALTKARKVQTRGIGMLLVFLALVGLVVAFNVPWIVRWFLVATPWWVQLPIAAFVVIGGLRLALWLGRLLIAVSKVRTLLSESAALAKARQSACENGTLVAEGPLTIWHSGPTDPVPMLLEQIEVTRAHFESLAGEPPPIETTLPPVICFHNRSRAFLAVPLVALTRRRPIATGCPLLYPAVVDDHALYSRELAPRGGPGSRHALCFAQCVRRRWLRLVAPALASRRDGSPVYSRDRREDLVRLNRRMVAAVERRNRVV